MNNLKFPTPKVTTFFYGMCSEDKLTEMIKQAEEDSCELVQVIAGMIPAPPSAVALPGTRQGPIPVLRILVRTTDENYAAMTAKRSAAPSKLVH